jgi:hypothetical protein
VLDWDEHELGIKLTGAMLAVPIQLKQYKIEKVAYEHSLSKGIRISPMQHSHYGPFTRPIFRVKASIANIKVSLKLGGHRGQPACSDTTICIQRTKVGAHEGARE